MNNNDYAMSSAASVFQSFVRALTLITASVIIRKIQPEDALFSRRGAIYMVQGKGFRFFSNIILTVFATCAILPILLLLISSFTDDNSAALEVRA